MGQGLDSTRRRSSGKQMGVLKPSTCPPKHDAPDFAFCVPLLGTGPQPLPDSERSPGHEIVGSTEPHCSGRSPGERGSLSSPQGSPRPWRGTCWFVPEDVGQGLSDRRAAWNANKLNCSARLVRWRFLGGGKWGACGGPALPVMVQCHGGQRVQSCFLC